MDAHTEVHWQYLRACVTFHLPSVADQKDDELEAIVVHELCHVLVNEMRWVDRVAENDDVHRHNIGHEERVVSCLTSAFQWVRQDGAKDVKKPQGKPSKKQPAKIEKRQGIQKKRMGMNKGNHN